MLRGGICKLTTFLLAAHASSYMDGFTMSRLQQITVFWGNSTLLEEVGPKYINLDEFIKS